MDHAAFAYRVCARHRNRSPPALVITSPGNGALMTSGQPLAITVTIVSGVYPKGIAIMGQAPLGATEMQIPAAPIMHFTLAIPSRIDAGKYAISAASVDSTGAMVTSAPVDVMVESAGSPTDLKINPPGIFFGHVDQTLPLTVFAMFAGGLPSEVTRFSHLIIDSANPQVAIVDEAMVKAMGGGDTLIHFQYGSIAKTISVKVPPYIRGNLNGDGRVDQSDLNVILAAKGWTANEPDDARDLNHDGIINELDADILRGLCTHPGCASQ